MDAKVCEKFENVWNDFPNTLTDDGKYQLKDKTFLNSYCFNYKCDSDLGKINAGFFYLLNQFFGSSELSHYGKNNINIVDYIILWLIYMLTLKENSFNNSIKYFYTTLIKSDVKYESTVDNVKDCHNFKDIIDKRHDLTKEDMDKNIISTLHDAFKLLCGMYTVFNDNTSNCAKCLGKANEFANKYEELKKYYSNTKNSSFSKILSTLSTDYDNLKNKCNGNSSFPSIEIIQSSENDSVEISGLVSEVASSSSSISKNLFIVLSIFGAIGFFLGISYKVNNMEFKNYFHYIYANVNTKFIRFLIYYISIRYLDFGKEFKNNI
ncbi:putative yir4 protein [Plasmodium yoelii yoelii]|uniref:Yir4 protein n=1 Tax=Plasmodium yoelii yoelii TaxID=73239 RepID=Q7R9F5_PLAYO|nr:putative yir4 protein [Plasmodium yoelii yoelii]